MLASETYWELVTDPNHWWLEITIMLVFDVIVGYFIWGAIKRHIHKDDKTLEETIREEVDRRFEELVQHMHDDSGVAHEDS